MLMIEPFVYVCQELQGSDTIKKIRNWFRNDKELLKNMSCSSHMVLLYIEKKYKRKTFTIWHACVD
jgi:hypothetical protein